MDKEILINENRVFYRVLGKGVRVVFIHGFAEDGEVWKNQYALQNKFQLIIPDIPGSGRSTMDDGPWTMDRFAEMIKSILDNENISSCVMIGHSMGGYISLAFAEKYPGILNGLGLFHSTAFADSDEKKANRKKGIAFMKQHGAYEFVKTTTPNLFTALSKSRNPAPMEDLIAKGNNFSVSALVSYYESMMSRPDRTAVLKIVKIPVLIIQGETDTAVPLEDALKQCHLPELSYFHIFKNSGHMGMIEEAEKSNRMLEEFIVSCKPETNPDL